MKLAEGNGLSFPLHLDLVTKSTSASEVLELRLLIEPALARLAAQRSTQVDIEYMRTLLGKSEASLDAESWEKWDSELHRAIAVAAHHTLLLSVFDAVNAIRGQVKWNALRKVAFHSVRKEAHCAHHRGCINAIEARNPDAAERHMRHHVGAVQQGIVNIRATMARSAGEST